MQLTTSSHYSAKTITHKRTYTHVDESQQASTREKIRHYNSELHINQYPLCVKGHKNSHGITLM